MDEAPLAVPVRHRLEPRSTNPLERLSRKAKRRADLVGLAPSEEPILRLVGAGLLEASDERRLQSRRAPIDGPALLATTKAARPRPPRPHQRPPPRRRTLPSPVRARAG